MKFRLSLLVKDTSNSNDQLGNKVCQAYFVTYEKLYNWQPFMTKVYFRVWSISTGGGGPEHFEMWWLENT